MFMKNRNSSIDSQDSIDASKRKRVSREENSPTEEFRRSKKTARTPDKRSKSCNTTIDCPDNSSMDELLSILQQMRADMKTNKDELIAEIKNNNDKIQELKNELKEKGEKWNSEKIELLARIGALETKIEKEDKRKKKNNIVIKGLQITSNLNNGINNFLRNEFNLQTQIIEAVRLNKPAEKSIILVQLRNWEDKLTILKNKYNLKQKQIYVENDYTAEERKIQAEIRAIAREERAKGANVRTGYQKLNVNDKWFFWNNLNKKLEEKHSPNDPKN